MTSNFPECQDGYPYNYYMEDGFSNEFINRLPDDFWSIDDEEIDRNVGLSNSSQSNESHNGVNDVGTMQDAMESMPVTYIHKPQPVVPTPVSVDYRGIAYVHSLSTPPVLQTPPNSPTDDDESVPECEVLNNIIREFPQILESQLHREPPNFNSILTDLHTDLPFAGQPIQDAMSESFCASPDFLSALPESIISSPIKYNLYSSHDYHQGSSSQRDVNLGGPSLFLSSERSCNSVTAGYSPTGYSPRHDNVLWSWGNEESPFYKASSKVRNVSGNSDAVVAKPSPIRFSDEEYDHLPETPMSNADADETSMSEINEKPCKVEVTDSFKNASVKSEHNYCGKNPSFLNASIDANSFLFSDDDADIKVVKIEKSAQPIKKPIRIIYKPNPTTSKKVNQNTTKIIFKPFTKISVGLSHENIPTTNSAEVKQQLLRTIQESMKNKYSRKIVVPKIDQSRPVPICAPKCKPDLLNSNSRKFSLLPQNTLKTRGKPEAYTKRIRDQHSETVKKTTKRRKLTNNSISIDKRKEHNLLERNRRINIKELFDRLKEFIPKIQNTKASKVHILVAALDLVKEFHIMDKNFELRKRLREMQSCTNFRLRSF